jgi:hypothetical protein
LSDLGGGEEAGLERGPRLRGNKTISDKPIRRKWLAEESSKVVVI